MRASSTHSIDHETILSYPGSLGKKAVRMVNLLQVTRIRLNMLIFHETGIGVYELGNNTKKR
jgi:hypothetical protein